MGTFAGHALPGSFFILAGVWWTISQFRRYYQSRLKNSSPYQNSATFPFFFLCGHLKFCEMEGLIKIFFSIVGFVGEVITGTKDGQFVYMGNAQHATMFFFFGMTGVIDLLLHYKVPLPKSIDYMSMALALLVEATLFKFHLHGRIELDVVIHTVLLYVVVMNIVAVFVEVRCKSSIIAGLARSYFIIVQGTWFWHVGFILYNPVGQSWKGENHDDIMMATTIFAWHLGAVFIIQLLIGGVVACVYRCTGQFEANNYDLLHMQLLRKGDNGHAVVNLQDEESESDIEYQRNTRTDHQ